MDYIHDKIDDGESKIRYYSNAAKNELYMKPQTMLYQNVIIYEKFLNSYYHKQLIMTFVIQIT